ncbi:LexA family protein (plasmid) [Pseudomonas mandelii]|uniref:LexA family protein n=1 Tax=Pseudomonas mandelii TaxID=75612 RepID=UPI00398D126D
MTPLSLIGRAFQSVTSRLTVPYFGLIHCGFPSPAEDYVLAELSLDELIILNPPATFMLRAAGNSMRDVNINPGDIVIVDKSRSAKHNSIVIAVYQGEFVCKRLIIDRKDNRITLQAENPEYPSITVEDRDQLDIWGVVTWTAHCHLDTP